MSLRLYAMTCGWLTMPVSALLEGGEGELRVPVPSYLIEHPNGRALFDSGLGLACQTEVEKYLGRLASLFEVEFQAGEEISARLECLDISAADVNFLINSHLHFDHAGGNALIPEARLVVQKREWDAGKEPDTIASMGYKPVDYDLGHDVLAVDGEHDVFGDGDDFVFLQKLAGFGDLWRLQRQVLIAQKYRQHDVKQQAHQDGELEPAGETVVDGAGRPQCTANGQCERRQPHPAVVQEARIGKTAGGDNDARDESAKHQQSDVDRPSLVVEAEDFGTLDLSNHATCLGHRLTLVSWLLLSGERVLADVRLVAEIHHHGDVLRSRFLVGPNDHFLLPGIV